MLSLCQFGHREAIGFGCFHFGVLRTCGLITSSPCKHCCCVMRVFRRCMFGFLYMSIFVGAHNVVFLCFVIMCNMDCMRLAVLCYDLVWVNVLWVSFHIIVRGSRFIRRRFCLSHRVCAWGFLGFSHRKTFCVLRIPALCYVGRSEALTIF